jgi:hypothetical protein
MRWFIGERNRRAYSEKVTGARGASNEIIIERRKFRNSHALAAGSIAADGWTNGDLPGQRSEVDFLIVRADKWVSVWAAAASEGTYEWAGATSRLSVAGDSKMHHWRWKSVGERRIHFSTIKSRPSAGRIQSQCVCDLNTSAAMVSSRLVS